MSGSRIERTELFSLGRTFQILIDCDFCDQRISGGCLKLLSKFRKDSTRKACSKSNRPSASSTVIPYRLNHKEVEKYINLLVIIIFCRTITSLCQFVQRLEGYKEIQKSGIHGSLPSLRRLKCGYSI